MADPDTLQPAKQLLDHPAIGSRYFFPRRAPLANPFVVATGGVELHCHREVVNDDGPWLLHFHGNGEVAADWIPGFTPALLEAGINVMLAEYRGYGGSSGEPALAAMLDDALAICDALGVDASRIVVYGRSVGSIYALHVAAHRPVAGLVIESGIADVLERLLLRISASELHVDDATLRAAVCAAFDHKAKIEACAGPVLVLHTCGDVLVRPEHGERLAAWAGERGTLKLFERGDHNTIHAYNAKAIIELVADFVRRAT